MTTASAIGMTESTKSTISSVSTRFDLAATLFAGWFVLGMYLDGWAHNHIPQLETFFTLWHAILYSGFFALAGLFAVTQYRNVAKGASWKAALPPGYAWSLWGIAIFAFGGLSDFLWHSLFGIEQTIDALFSPTHLILACGAGLMVTGPLRAAWARRGDQRGWKMLFPAIFSLLYLLLLFTFMTQFANIMISPTIVSQDYTPPDYDFVAILAAVTGIVSLLVPAVITMGVILFALRRWTLPFGSLTLLIGISNLAMYLMRADDLWRYSPAKYWPIIFVPFVVGLLADMLLLRLKPSPERSGTLRLFAFIVPFVLYTALVLMIGAIGGLSWEIHMWIGVPFLAGIICLILSFLVVPPAIPTPNP